MKAVKILAAVIPPKSGEEDNISEQSESDSEYSECSEEYELENATLNERVLQQHNS